MWAGSFLEKGGGACWRRRGGAKYFFFIYFFVSLVSKSFLVWFFWFISLKCCGGSRFFFDFFSLSHVTLLLIQSSSYIKDRLRNLTSFFFNSVFKFSRHLLTSLLMRCCCLYSWCWWCLGRKSSHQWAALGVVCLFLSNNIDQGSICSFSFLLSPTWFFS